MIFPKSQMQVENETPSLLKKQAIQLIIELYLKRERDQDISFLTKNFGTTGQIANSIGSRLISGLTSESVAYNKLYYGENEGKKSPKCLTLLQCMEKELFSLYFGLSIFISLTVLIVSSCFNMSEVQHSSAVIVIASVFGLVLRVLVYFFYSRKMGQISASMIKAKSYQVVRNGIQREIDESEIVVGDIVELGYRETVPATGIILSSHENIFKENRKSNSSQVKVNLEGCIKKVGKMSGLQLKNCIDQQNLPSPIIIRGSELKNGKSYSIMVISVTEQNLLSEFDYEVQDKLQCKQLSNWTTNLQSKWNKIVAIVGSICIVFLFLQEFMQFKLLFRNKLEQDHFAYQFGLKISVLLLVLAPASVISFINCSFVKLLSGLKIVDNFKTFFTLKQIICNEKCIANMDEITGLQIIAGGNDDIISIEELSSFDNNFLQLLSQAAHIFKIKMGEYLEDDEIEQRKSLMQVNSFRIKIISVLLKRDEIAKSRIQKKKNSSIKTKLNEELRSIDNDKENGHNINKNIIKLSKMKKRKSANLKDILNERCFIRTNLILDNLVGLAENSMKTFYYQIFEPNALSKITHFQYGETRKVLGAEQKNQLINLAKKMQIVYNITPVVLSYGNGAYSLMANRTLICIMGVKIHQNMQIMNSLLDLAYININSLVIKNSTLEEQEEDSQQIQKAICDQYKSRCWITSESQADSEILECENIKKTFGRVVCSQCLIASCICKSKVQEVSNIQPFLQQCDKVKIIYNVHSEDIRLIESVYRQLYRDVLLINSEQASASDWISSIFSCLNFLENLRRSILPFICISSVFFLSSILVWMGYYQTLTPTQICFSFVLLTSCFGIGCLVEIKDGISHQRTQDRRSRCIIAKEEVLRCFSVCCFLIIVVKLFEILNYLIPEEPDLFGEELLRQKIDLFSCKYGPGYSVIKTYSLYNCKTSMFGFQPSRLSTMMIAYLYYSLWLLTLILRRNFKSPISLIFCYSLTLLLFLASIQFLPAVCQTYSQGLTLVQYGIVLVAGTVSVILGMGIGTLLGRVEMLRYLACQLESRIQFEEKQFSYVDRLKMYWNRKMFINNATIQNICALHDSLGSAP